jgi:hypothetical protein
MGFFRVCQHIRSAEPVLACWTSRNVYNKSLQEKFLWHLHCMVLGISGAAVPMFSIRSFVPSASLNLITRASGLHFGVVFQFNQSFVTIFLYLHTPAQSATEATLAVVVICLLNTPYRLRRISRASKSRFTAKFFFCHFLAAGILAGEGHILLY